MPPPIESQPERISLRGITTGVVLPCDGSARPCWLFLDHKNMDWLMAVSTSRQYRIQKVYCRSPDGSLEADWLDMLKEHRPEVHSWPCSHSPRGGTDVVCLFNFRVGQRELRWLEKAKVDVLVTTKGIRSVDGVWRRQSVHIEHPSVGGVTQTKATLVLGLRKIDTLNLLIPPSRPRDVGTILGFSVDCQRRYCPAPHQLEVDPLRCVNLGTLSAPVYHGLGLLPASPSLETQVALRAVKVRKGYWGVRRLTPKELLQTYDVGDRFLPLNPALDPGFCPIGILRAFLSALVTCKVCPMETSPFMDTLPGSSPQKRPLGAPPETLGTVESVAVVAKQTLSQVGSVVSLPERDTVSVAAPNTDDVPGKPDNVTGKTGNVTGGDFFNDVDSDADTIWVSNVAKDTSNSSLVVGPETVFDSDNDEDDSVFLSIPSLQGRGLNHHYEDEDDDRDEEDDRDERERKATKSDDAAVPTHLWREHLMADGPSPWSQEQAAPLDHVDPTMRRVGLDRAMEILQSFLLRRWKKRITNSFTQWYRRKHAKKLKKADQAGRAPFVAWDSARSRYIWKADQISRFHYRTWWKKACAGCKDFAAGRDALYRCCWCSWWEWDAGSRPHFWRWPEEIQHELRDGTMVFFKSEKPSYLRPQQKERDPEVKRKVEKKLQKVVDRGYLSNEEVIESLTSFFQVPKGTDIRMVHDGTKSGLNDAIWVPSFFMPTMASHLRAVAEGTYMCDVDIGEMFLNFMLHPDMRELCGIDLTPFDIDYGDMEFPEDAELRRWLSWCRCAMGLKSSPYQAVRFMHFAEEVIRGEPSDASNVFHWDRVRLNLPGSQDYDPSLPWVSKVKKGEEGIGWVIAADLFTFVDDLRPTGSSKKESWMAARRAASILNFLGIQDAARKRRDSRTDPGAWAGCVLRTEGGVFALVSDDKWSKMKSLVQELRELIDHTPKAMPRKRLEVIRGFMNYVTQTHRYMIPYLNGLHMTIDGWREGRDEDGWKLPKPPKWQQPDLSSSLEEPNVPEYVEAKRRLHHDVEALETLCSPDAPPWRRVRPKRSASVVYGFGDASGPAFGASSQKVGREGVHFEYGQWISSISQEESSNWREFTNLVEYLEGRAACGDLDDTEVFMFTDNSTTEAAFWKGTSPYEKLCSLVLRLRKLEMQHGMTLHIIHVSGRRMIAQGTDGLSRGDHSSGVMRGESMASFVPLHLNALERSPRVKPWVENILSGLNPHFCSPEDWFSPVTQKEGTFAWTPAPAAADAMVERLAMGIHKRPNSLHLVLLPCLMTGRWRKQLLKLSDFDCRLLCDSIWNLETEFEPLLMFIALPFLPHRPCFEAKEDIVKGLGGLLCKANVWEIDTPVHRNLLRELLVSARAFPSL